MPEYKSCSSTETLLRVGAILNTADNYGAIALHLAAQIGNANLIILLLEAQAIVDCRGLKGQAALHYCCRGYLSSAAERLLLEHNTDVDAVSETRQTALHMACLLGCHSVAKTLLEFGADVNKRDKHGQTPMHVAAASAVFANLAGKLMIEILMGANADYDLRDVSGKRALDVARNTSWIGGDIVKLLQDATKVT